MTAEANTATLEQANAAITAGDVEGFLARCTDDTTWTVVGDRTRTGQDAVRRWMADAYQAPPRFRVRRLLAEGDSVAAAG